MALYEEQFVIINNSPYTLYLDKEGSSGLGNGKWPAAVEPNSTVGPFLQTGNLSVNPTAAYNCGGSNPPNPPVTIYMHFYCTGLDPLVHVNMTMPVSGSKPFPGSCIAETNSHSNQKVCTPSPLAISTTDNGATRGTATFTVGNPGS